MGIRTTSVPEILLQLISAHATADKNRLNPGLLWREIVEYMKIEGTVFSLYYRNQDPNDPSPQFRGDLAELIRGGFVILRDGALEISSIGQCLAWAREVPPNYKPLEDQILQRRAPA